MDESREATPHPAAATGSPLKISVRPWVLYVLVAVIWPIAVEAIIAMEVFLTALGHSLGASSDLLEAACALLAVAAAALGGWLIGLALSRAGAPGGLFALPVAWAVVAVAAGAFGFGAADVRQLFGLVGVVGVFVLGAAGFWLGIRST